MPRPEDCYFTKQHEWVHVEGEEVRIGVSDFAQKELGDIVYVELKDAGAQLDAGEELGTIESVKAVAEVYAPIGGTIVSANPLLADHPERINEDPHDAGWLVTMTLRDAGAVRELMDHAAYEKFLEEEDH